MMASTNADVFHAIADPNRRKILDLLRKRERPVQELVTHFDVSFGAISQHLKVLRNAGLVARRSEGRQRVYRLNPLPMRKIHDWTALYERSWRQRFRRLRSHLREEG